MWTIITNTNKNKVGCRDVIISYIKCPVFNKNYETGKERWDFNAYIEERATNTKYLSGDPDVGFSRKDINSAI